MSTKFSKDGQQIIAGGSGMNEIKVFANDADSEAKFQTQLDLRSLPEPVLEIDVSSANQEFVFGLAKGKSFICNYESTDKQNKKKHLNYNGNFDFFARKSQELVKSRNRGIPA